jgi:hypothetical protein
MDASTALAGGSVLAELAWASAAADGR